MKLIAAVAGFVAIGQGGANVEAQTTQVHVRVVSHDAKIIGDPEVLESACKIRKLERFSPKGSSGAEPEAPPRSSSSHMLWGEGLRE